MRVVITAGILIAAFGGGALLLRTRDYPPAVNIVPFTSVPGFEFQPSFSPEGTQIAFTAVRDGDGPDIYVKAIGDEKMLRLTRPPGSSSCPEWSPDGRTISFSHREEVAPGQFEKAIFVMTPIGGGKRKLRQVFDFKNALSGSCFSSWSPDSRLLAYNDQPTGEASGIFLMPASGSPVERVTTAPTGMFDAHPAFSPSGKFLAFVRTTDDGGNPAIYLVDARGPGTSRRAEKKIAALRGITRLTWTADGKRIIFSALGFFLGESTLYSVPVSGGAPERLQYVSSDGFSPAISRQGNKLAYASGFLDANIWSVPLNTALAATKVISSTRVDMQPRYSPDGSKLVFVSNRDGAMGLWFSGADGSDPVRLSSRLGATPTGSPDGKYVAFDSNENGHWRVFVRSIDDGAEMPLTDDDADNRAPSWSADGHWIYSSSNRSGKWEIWKTSFQTHKSLQLTHSGGTYGQGSRDGKLVYFQKPRSKKEYDFSPVPEIWSMSIDGADEQRVVKMAEHPEERQMSWFWQPTDTGIYFVDNTARPKPLLKSFDFRTHAVRKIRALEKPTWGGPGLAVSPDGHNILLSQIDDAGADIMLVENFH